MGHITQDNLDNWFTYHAPTEDQIEKYQKLRQSGKFLAETILENVPDGPDQSAAIRKVREAIMTANAGLACDS